MVVTGGLAAETDGVGNRGHRSLAWGRGRPVADVLLLALLSGKPWQGRVDGQAVDAYDFSVDASHRSNVNDHVERNLKTTPAHGSGQNQLYNDGIPCLRECLERDSDN